MNESIFLSDMLDASDVDAAVAAGLVSRREGPGGLTVLNYTKTAQFDRDWSAVTITCRGLIVDAESRVVARPFPKFFNYGEPDAPVVSHDTRVMAFDKLDGSLGICFTDPTDDLASIATRGSFESEQAVWATEHLRDKYSDFAPEHNVTYLFEIIAPVSRVVVNYDVDGLVLLARIDTVTGHDVSGPGCWPGPTADRFEDVMTLADAVVQQDADVANREGLVLLVEGTSPTVRLKVKYETYVALHRWLSNTTAKTVRNALAVDELHQWLNPTAVSRAFGCSIDESERLLGLGGRAFQQLVEATPDEWFSWLQKVTAELKGQTDQHAGLLDHIVATLSVPDDAKASAIAFQASHVPVGKLMAIRRSPYGARLEGWAQTDFSLVDTPA